MTSPRTTTSDSGRRPGALGFTLIELLLVLALAMLLAAMVGPTMSGTLARVRLDAAAERLQTEWNSARLEAIRSGEPVAFQCRLQTGEYVVSPLSQAASALVGATPDAESDELTDDEYEDLGDIVFTQLSVGDPLDETIDPTVAACLVFQPDGATQNAFAVLQAEDGKRRRVKLRGLTGAAVVESVSVAEGAP